MIIDSSQTKYSRNQIVAALRNAALPNGKSFREYDSKPITSLDVPSFLDEGSSKTVIEWHGGRHVGITLYGNKIDTEGFDRENQELIRKGRAPKTPTDLVFQRMAKTKVDPSVEEGLLEFHQIFARERASYLLARIFLNDTSQGIIAPELQPYLLKVLTDDPTHDPGYILFREILCSLISKMEVNDAREYFSLKGSGLLLSCKEHTAVKYGETYPYRANGTKKITDAIETRNIQLLEEGLAIYCGPIKAPGKQLDDGLRFAIALDDESELHRSKALFALFQLIDKNKFDWKDLEKTFLTNRY